MTHLLTLFGTDGVRGSKDPYAARSATLTFQYPLEAHLLRIGFQQSMEAQSHGVCKTKVARSRRRSRRNELATGSYPC